MDAIVTEGLSKRYGARVAVDALSMAVPAGQVFGFLGPNGAGKTTTIAMLLGLVRPSAGRALIFGRDVWREPAPALADVGAMIDGPAFYPYLSGRDNLLALARAEGLPDGRAAAALAAVGLSDRARDRYRAYSQGMRQRLGIAAALLREPRLLILDEPSNGLDPAGQREIRELIRDLAASGHTIFVSSHQLHEVEQVCDEVAILKAGRLLACGPVAALLRRGRGVLVRVAAEPERAAELLRGLAWVAGVAPHGGSLLVDAPAERAAELSMALAAAGIAVAEIRARDASLEEFFLQTIS
ncbi:ABC transporter ATP-binding protein [Kouleothrix sp.]|uniref:ABC transporter ATP-binding protein n=1 Tax=Kouleothrix sp. TaxID=2779161 RepID=UPI00391A1C90